MRSSTPLPLIELRSKGLSWTEWLIRIRGRSRAFSRGRARLSTMLRINLCTVANRSDIPLLKRALALRSVLNGFRTGRHSWIVVSVIESGVLAGMPSRQRSCGGVRRGVTGSASIGAAASARASARVSGTVPTTSVFVLQVSGRSHARAYRRHRQLQSVVPGRAGFRVSKRRFTAIVVVVVVVVAAAAVRRSLRNKISVGAVDATRSFDRRTEKLVCSSPLLVSRR